MKVTTVPPTDGTANGNVVRLVEFSSDEPETFASRRHDFAQSTQRFETAITMMERGFDFTTRDGARLLGQLKDALIVIKSHEPLLRELYRDATR